MAKTAKAPQQQFINKRIFDTDNAMKGTFNGLFGRWQLITNSFFVFGYALCIGWINNLLDFSLLGSGDAICANVTEIVDPTIYSNYTNRSLIQRLSGEKKFKALIAMIDMTELQKKKANSSKLRFFLNSLKGKGYRSTNTIYCPFDFIFSPTLLVYVTILCGLWFTNGLTNSIEIDDVKKASNFEYYIEMTLSHLTFVVASILAVCLSVFKIGRRWMIFLAYVLVEICLLGSLIANFTYPKSDTETQVALVVLYHLCKFSAYFGLIFLMLITARVI